LEYTDEAGVTSTVDLSTVIDNFETLTTIVDNNDGTFTYTDEDGTPTIIDVSNLETLTTIALNPDNIHIDYTDEDGVVTQLDLSAIIANLETLTTIVDNNDGTFTYTDEDGTPTIIDVSNLETLTSMVQDDITGVITYTDEDGIASTAEVISADANNLVQVGTDGGSFIDATTLTEPWFSADTNTGATLNTEDIYHFGYVGIGTEAPDRGLLIENNNINDNKDDIMIRTYSGISSNTPAINLRRAAGTADAPENLVDGDNIGALAFTAYSNGDFGSWHQTGLRAYYKGDGVSGETELEFRTSDASQMFITKDGNINFVQYPNTRDDSGIAAVDNLLYTDAFGNMLSAPAASVVSEPWFDQATNDQATENTQDIYQMGKVGILTDDMLGTADPDVVLAINGKMLTPVSIYADYVFEDYFEGFSGLNADYTFKSLGEVEQFINENRHLPGITKIDALAKTEKGDYIINPSELSVQVLEKVEELYLHTIEQQKLLETKDREINILQKEAEDMKERLERLEKLLPEMQ
ncbi:hypothetical protein ACVBDU_16395, partial [Sinomicrobium sp. M5D2P9]